MLAFMKTGILVRFKGVAALLPAALLPVALLPAVLPLLFVIIGCMDPANTDNGGSEPAGEVKIIDFTILQGTTPIANGDAITVNPGGAYKTTVAVSLLPSGVSGTVIWKSGNAAVTVTPAGGNSASHSASIEGITPGGNAVITVSVVNGYMTAAISKTFTVSVNDNVIVVPVSRVNIYRPGETVVLNGQTINLTQANTVQLAAALIPALAVGTVSWSSSAPAVATVANGLVTATGEGSAVISARVDGTLISASVTVSVTAAPVPDPALIWQWDYAKHGVQHGINWSGSGNLPVPGAATLNGEWGDGSATAVPVGRRYGTVTVDAVRGGIVMDATGTSTNPEGLSTLIIGTSSNTPSNGTSSPAGVFDFRNGNNFGIAITVDIEVLTPSPNDRTLRVLLNNNGGSQNDSPLGAPQNIIFDWLPAVNSAPTKGEWDSGEKRFKTVYFLPGDFTQTYISTLGTAFFQLQLLGNTSNLGGKLLIKGIRIERDLGVEEIFYSDYGAVGNGTTDDFDAIIAAHTAANRYGAKVYATAGATYYIGGGLTPAGAAKTARIQTDTDWTGANFTIDDTAVGVNTPAWTAHVFEITSAQQPYAVTPLPARLDKNQASLNRTFPSDTIVVATNSNKKHYIRRGLNENTGSNQSDVFIVKPNGAIDQSATIIWDFATVTSLSAYPIDEDTLTVTGGTFTTKANTGTVDDSYMWRGIRVARSNTIINGLKHFITGEGEAGAPYGGFLFFERCANVRVENAKFTGHRVYSRNGVQSGTYDINADRAINLSFIDCEQMNSITDDTYWGIFTSNYSKNIVFNRVKFSRFDAHQGVHNATILNSELGHQGVTIIGSGLLRIENTTVRESWYFIQLRPDYGSSFEGTVTIKDCTFASGSRLVPGDDNPLGELPTIIFAQNNGWWDFGYPCYMPQTVTINGFTVEDTAPPAGYNGVYLYNVFDATDQGPNLLALTNTVYLSRYNSSRPYLKHTDSHGAGGIQVVEQ